MALALLLDNLLWAKLKWLWLM